MSKRMLGVAMMVLSMMAATALADVVVLKSGSQVSINDDLDPAFDGVTAADIVNVAIDDTAFHDNWADNSNGGALTVYDSSHDDMLFKFDLASVPGFIGSTVHVAQLRLHQNGGNSGGAVAPVITHDWTEALARRSDPAGSNADKWGPASNAKFSSADYGTLTTMLWDGFEAVGSEPYHGWLTGDVTADAQAIADGGNNFGWYAVTANRNIYSDENSYDLGRPALFLYFTPAAEPVPEPAGLGLLGLALLGLRTKRRR